MYPNASKYCLSIPTDYSKLSNLEKKVNASNKNFMAVVEDRDGKLESDLENQRLELENEQKRVFEFN